MLDQVYPILTQTAQRLLHLAIAAKPPVVAGVAVGDAVYVYSNRSLWIVAFAQTTRAELVIGQNRLAEVSLRAALHSFDRRLTCTYNCAYRDRRFEWDPGKNGIAFPDTFGVFEDANALSVEDNVQANSGS
jgi:hypothetical protein